MPPESNQLPPPNFHSRPSPELRHPRKWLREQLNRIENVGAVMGYLNLSDTFT
jgi:hypothetical protein